MALELSVDPSGAKAMQKIIELKIEETKAVVGGIKVAAPPAATGTSLPVPPPAASRL
jgi:hypothetical protein